MLEFRSLKDEGLEAIHAAFLDAFSDYQVPIDMPFENFEELITTRSFSPSLSLGCYDDGLLAGFTLVGLREVEGVLTCYDVATGLIKSHQGRGLARQMFEALAATARKAGATSFLLEVLEENAPAISVYRKAGFKELRRLLCFEAPLEAGREILEPEPAVLAVADRDQSRYCSFRPSWQNSLESYRNAADKYFVVTVEGGAKGLAGYAIAHRRSGSILQLGAEEGPGRDQVVKDLIGKIARRTKAGKLRYLNVEAGSWMASLLPELGFSNSVNQLEMGLKL